MSDRLQEFDQATNARLRAENADLHLRLLRDNAYIGLIYFLCAVCVVLFFIAAEGWRVAAGSDVERDGWKQLHTMCAANLHETLKRCPPLPPAIRANRDDELEELIGKIMEASESSTTSFLKALDR